MISISPNPFEDNVMTEIIGDDFFPVDLYIQMLGSEEIVLRDRIFTSKKIVDVSTIRPGTYKLVMKKEREVLFETFATKLQ